jgi:hypothetical protein
MFDVGRSMFSLDQYAGALPFKNRSKVAVEIEALRRAGLK